MSGVEPGPNGTMILTVFVGQSCAAAGTTANNSPDSAKAKRLFIEFSRSPLCSSSAACFALAAE
jgi:hypothetical protein